MNACASVDGGWMFVIIKEKKKSAWRSFLVVGKIMQLQFVIKKKSEK